VRTSLDRPVRLTSPGASEQATESFIIKQFASTFSVMGRLGEYTQNHCHSERALSARNLFWSRHRADSKRLREELTPT